MNRITDNFINITATRNSTIPTIIGRVNCSATSIIGVDRTAEIVSEVTNRTYYVYVKSPNCTKYL